MSWAPDKVAQDTKKTTTNKRMTIITSKSVPRISWIASEWGWLIWHLNVFFMIQYCRECAFGARKRTAIAKLEAPTPCMPRRGPGGQVLTLLVRFATILRLLLFIVCRFSASLSYIFPDVFYVCLPSFGSAFSAIMRFAVSFCSFLSAFLALSSTSSRVHGKRHCSHMMECIMYMLVQMHMYAYKPTTMYGWGGGALTCPSVFNIYIYIYITVVLNSCT